MSSPYQPVFTDGWAPSITEPELIGIVNSMVESEHESDEHAMRHQSNSKRDSRNDFSRSSAHFDDSDDYEDNNLGPHRGS